MQIFIFGVIRDEYTIMWYFLKILKQDLEINYCFLLVINETKYCVIERVNNNTYRLMCLDTIQKL